MSWLVTTLLILTLISVTGVLGVGIFSMIKGGEFNEKHGNRLMQARVALQALALLLLAVSYYLSQG